MRLARISSRVAASGASTSMSSSKVRFASSIIAHSSPRSSSPWPAKWAGSTSRGSLPSCSSPSELASRRAGSIVTTATRWPRAASPIATAAAVVVLPTPPEPVQMQMRLPAMRSATLTAPAPARAARAPRDRARTGTRTGSVTSATPSRLPAQPGDLRALMARPCGREQGGVPGRGGRRRPQRPLVAFREAMRNDAH